MALPIGKLTILIGAGIAGSILSQEGKLSDFLSGAAKFVFKHLRQDDARSTRKPQNDSLLTQVNRLREELQILAASGPVTIITARGSGPKSFGVPVVIVVGGVVGYGIILWKGWKISNFLFATRRSLADASKIVGESLEKVHSSIAVAKRLLSSKLDHVDHNVDECNKIANDTLEEVTELKGEIKGFSNEVEFVQNAVHTLESKLGRLEGKQDIANHGICFLVDCASNIEGRRNIEASPASSGPPKLSGITHSPRTLSTPPAVLALEPPSPSSKVLSRTGSRSLQPASPSGLKVLQVMSDQSCPPVMAASHGSQTSEGTSSSSSASLFGWKLGVFLTRTKSSAT